MIALPTTQHQTPAAIPAALEDDLLQAIISGQFPTLLTPDPAASPSSTSSLRHSVTSLSSRFGLSLRLLLDFLAAPTTRARIAAAVAASDLALHQRTQASRHKALDALEHLLDTTEDPIEKRRAATALLRGPARNPPTSAWSARAYPDQDRPSPRPLRNPPDELSDLPKPATPESIVLTCVDRLQDNDNPTPNAGLETLHNFYNADLTPKERAEHLPEFLTSIDDDARLLNASTVILHPPIPQMPCESLDRNHPDKHIPPDHRFSQRIELTFPDLSTHEATFHLRRDPDSRITPHLWTINRIDHHFDEDQDIDNDDPTDEDDSS